MSDIEEWRVIPTAMQYMASNQGRLLNTKTGKIMAQYPHKTGYLYASLPGSRYVHVRVTEAFYGPRPPAYQAAHSDGDRWHNCPANLAWKTVKENAYDTFLHGRKGRLSFEQVIAIRRAVASGRTQSAVAKVFDISQMQVSRIIRGISWPHLHDPENRASIEPKVGLPCPGCGRIKANDLGHPNAVEPRQEPDSGSQMEVA